MPEVVTEEPTIAEPWTVGDLARLAKCTLRAIRFYEQRGLLHAPERTEGRHRRYTREDLELLRAIIALRRAGLPIEEIRRALRLRKSRTAAAAAHELSELLERQIRNLGEHLDQLQLLKSDFEDLHRALRACKHCQDASYPKGCAECEKSRQFSSASALRVLWNHER